LDLDHLSKIHTNYHIIINQISNNLTPTRHLRNKFLANSRRIKNATEQYDLGLISVWQFLQRCSYLSTAYIERQRLWAIQNNEDDDEIPDVEFDDEPPVLAPVENLPPLEVEVPLEVANREPVPASLCLVCMTATTLNSEEQFIVLPCGHGWLCGVCVVSLDGPNCVCPICRRTHVTFQRIYFA